ncbi:MAG: hypothetical protein HQL94_00145 [Magnetococcales bacterium]|nr:hypothetical protein [Magnetococcales bacterium]MBF0437595.1 hypothetical protein [Magnetococcales bacterium]
MDMKFFPDESRQETDDAALFFDPNHLSADIDLDIDDLESVIKAISLWLDDTMPVELIAYWNPRQHKSHLVYKPSQDDKIILDEIVKQIIHGAAPRIRHWRQQQWFFHLWIGSPLDTWDRLLIVEKNGSLSSDECNNLLQAAITIFQDSLRNAISKAENV